jgi:hypothetical protein
LEPSCCQAVFMQNMVCEIIYGYLMYVFHEFFTSLGGIAWFSGISSNC